MFGKKIKYLSIWLTELYEEFIKITIQTYKIWNSSKVSELFINAPNLYKNFINSYSYL